MVRPAVFGLVIDDHPLVAHGVTAFLRGHAMLEDAFFAADEAAALAVLAKRGSPAIVLIDFWLGGADSLGVMRRLAAAHPRARLLVMTGDDDPALRQHVAAGAAHGFIRKRQPPADFERAVTALLSGGTWFDGADDPLEGAAAPPREVIVTPAELGMTERQGQVLALILRGLPNKRISQELAVSESTVKEHVSAILSRSHARTRAELIAGFRGRRLRVPGAS